MKASSFYIDLAIALASHRATGRTSAFKFGIIEFLKRNPDAEKIYIACSSLNRGRIIAEDINSTDFIENNKTIKRVFAIEESDLSTIGVFKSNMVIFEHTAVEHLMLEAGRSMEVLESCNSALNKRVQTLENLLIKNNIPF